MEIKALPLVGMNDCLFPMRSFSCSLPKPTTLSAVYFQNPIVLDTVETQKQNWSLDAYSLSMSLMHRISLLNQELPPAWKFVDASAFSVALPETFLFSVAQPRIPSSLLPIPRFFSAVGDALAKAPSISEEIPSLSIGAAAQGQELQPGREAPLDACSSLLLRGVRVMKGRLM